MNQPMRGQPVGAQRRNCGVVDPVHEPALAKGDRRRIAPLVPIQLREPQGMAALGQALDPTEDDRPVGARVQGIAAALLRRGRVERPDFRGRDRRQNADPERGEEDGTAHESA